ncbi:MAG: hypothetical protein ACTSQS_03305 [Promethearchaeota archaeon]
MKLIYLSSIPTIWLFFQRKDYIALVIFPKIGPFHINVNPIVSIKN